MARLEDLQPHASVRGLLADERKKRTAEALSYNALVQSWPEIQRLARERAATGPPAQEELFSETETDA